MKIIVLNNDDFWQTYGEYLDAVEQCHPTINVCGAKNRPIFVTFGVKSITFSSKSIILRWF